MAKRKRMLVKDKKALLDKLLEFQEQQAKINEAQERLYVREEKLDARREKLVGQLAAGITGNEESLNDPILYRGQSFLVSRRNHWDDTYAVQVTALKKL